jgi:hypothetical protein
MMKIVETKLLDRLVVADFDIPEEEIHINPKTWSEMQMELLSGSLRQSRFILGCVYDLEHN